MLAVVYLIFNEGYSGRGRNELVAEALRLGRSLAELMPDEPEVHGLLAMMLLLDARRAARAARRRARPARRPGPHALGRRGRSPPGARARPRARPARARPLRGAGGDRLPARRRAARLGRDRRALRRARAPDRLARGRAQPRGRGGRGARAPTAGLAIVDGLAARRLPLPARHPRRAAAPSRTRRARREPPTRGRSTSPTTTPSAACSSAGWPSCADAARILRVVAWEAQSLLPLPPHYHPGRVGEVWRVPYEDRAREAPRGRASTASARRRRTRCASRCSPSTSRTRSASRASSSTSAVARGSGAVDDNRRLAEFLYRNLAAITQVFPSLDTHHAMQIFHAIWLVDDGGAHPAPYTLVSPEDVADGRWQVNPAVADEARHRPRLRPAPPRPLHARAGAQAANTI